jgi:hypothetical protein
METKGITIEAAGKLVDNNRIDDKAKKRFKRPAYGIYGKARKGEDEQFDKRTEESN